MGGAGCCTGGTGRQRRVGAMSSGRIGAAARWPAACP